MGEVVILQKARFAKKNNFFPKSFFCFGPTRDKIRNRDKVRMITRFDMGQNMGKEIFVIMMDLNLKPQMSKYVL